MILSSLQMQFINIWNKSRQYIDVVNRYKTGSRTPSATLKENSKMAIIILLVYKFTSLVHLRGLEHIQHYR